MLENGNIENLDLLKQAILDEADKFLKIQKINTNNEVIEQKSSLESIFLTSNEDEDLTKTILKIDEFLENLDKKELSSSIEISKNNDQTKNEFEICRFNSLENNGLSTSSTLCSENSTISHKSVRSDVKSILKQKLLDAAQRAGSKESKNGFNK